MTDVDANLNSFLPPLRWYQFRLRSLLLLAVVVALVAGLWTSYEEIRYKVFTRGNDAVISTDRFEVIVKGAGSNSEEEGIMQVGGFGFESSRETVRNGAGVVRGRSHEYSWGVLRFEINGVKFSLHNHAREVVVDGHTYSIRYRAIITIDQRGKITVEDRPPDGPRKNGP